MTAELFKQGRRDAIADAQARLRQRVLELSGEFYGDECPYWPRVAAKRGRAK